MAVCDLLVSRCRQGRPASIFLDQVSGDATRLAFAGRLFNDTLQLHWIPDYAADENDASWQLFFCARTESSQLIAALVPLRQTHT